MIRKRDIDLKALAESSILIVIAKRTSKSSRKVSKEHKGNKSTYSFKAFEYQVEAVVRDSSMMFKYDNEEDEITVNDVQAEQTGSHTSLEQQTTSQTVTEAEPTPLVAPSIPQAMRIPASDLPSSGYKAPKMPTVGSKIFVASEQASDRFKRDELFVRGGSMTQVVSEYKTSFVGLPSDKKRPLAMLFLDPSQQFSRDCEWEPASLVYYESPEKADEVRSFFRKI